MLNQLEKATSKTIDSAFKAAKDNQELVAKLVT